MITHGVLDRPPGARDTGGRTVGRLVWSGLSLLFAVTLLGEARISGASAQPALIGAKSRGPAASLSVLGELEFHAYVYLNGQPSVSIARVLPDGSVRSCWLGLNEAGNGCVVRGFDERSATVTIECSGHIFPLTLDRAPPSLTADGLNTVEAARRASMAEAIGRRRAQRWGPFGAEGP